MDNYQQHNATGNEPTLENAIADYLRSVPVVRCANCRQLLGVIGSTIGTSRLHCMECDAFLELDLSKGIESATKVLEVAG